MPKLTKFDFVVFDCDGVILDSNPIKTKAFRHAIDEYPEELVERLVAYHLEHGGVSRYDKFTYFFETLVGEPSERGMQQALSRFEQYCKTELLTAEFIPGSVGYIRRLSRNNVPLFVVSGSDQQELREVLAARNLAECFREIRGSPTSKGQNLENILEAYDLEGKGVYFGDAKLDCEIARNAGMEFVLVWGASDWQDGKSFCESLGIRCIKDFTGLK